MKRFLSPKQAALSLGVSESSLKRWCDRGKLEMQLTAGGHRKISIASVVQLVRREQREIVRPELLGLSSSCRANSDKLDDTVEQLASALSEGEVEGAKRIVIGRFLQSQSIAKLCDELISPALATIGKTWSDGDLEIYEEHRSVQIVHELLASLEAMVPRPVLDASVAMGGSIERDVYALPTRMIELCLRDAGWNATSLGTSLPFSTLAAAITKHRPRLFWLSISVLSNQVPTLIELERFISGLPPHTEFYVGGRSTPHEIHSHEKANYCRSIQDLLSASELLSRLPKKELAV